MAGSADEPARASEQDQAAPDAAASQQPTAPEPPPSNTASVQGGEPGQSRQESGDDEDGEDDEDETCGFCIFMKAGGCRKSFTAWSKCVDAERDRGGDFAHDCREQTFAMRECMLEHKEYYAPVLGDEGEYVADKEEAAKTQAQAS